jgi:hypothetical protein
MRPTMPLQRMEMATQRRMNAESRRKTLVPVSPSEAINLAAKRKLR